MFEFNTQVNNLDSHTEYSIQVRTDDKVKYLYAQDSLRQCIDGHLTNKWIGVEERLPEIDPSKGSTRWRAAASIRVLCACKQRSGKQMIKEGYCDFYYDGHYFWRIPGSIDSVTHWMYLPEPPVEGGNSRGREY